MISRRGLERRQTSSAIIGHRGKKIWTEEEDEHLKKLVEMYGTTNWTLIAQSLPERSGKQCRERFHNHLDIGIKKGDWTEEEDKIIMILQNAIGNQWAKITKMLPGRTDNAVKNRFHATERAKSRGKLDDSFMSDPIYTDFIVKEALRLNGESEGATSVANGSDYDSPESSAHSIYPLANAIFSPMNHIQPSPSDLAIADAFFQGEEDMEEQSVTEAVAVSLDNDLLEAEEEGDEEDMEEGSVNGLMELDIISIDEDDLDFDESEENHSQLRPQESNGCFSFNWSNSNKSSFSPERKIGNYCGLETWGMTRAAQPQQIGQHQQQYAVQMTQSQSIGGGIGNSHNYSAPQMFPQPAQQQQQAPPPQQQYGFSFGYNPTTFFCSR